MPFEGIEPWQIPTYSDGYRPAAYSDEDLLDVFYDEAKEEMSPEAIKMLSQYWAPASWGQSTNCPFFIVCAAIRVYNEYMKNKNTMFNSDLTPMFDGCVLMNESAIKDKAVMAAMTKLAEDGFVFRSHPTGSWNISDRH